MSSSTESKGSVRKMIESRLRSLRTVAPLRETWERCTSEWRDVRGSPSWFGSTCGRWLEDPSARVRAILVGSLCGVRALHIVLRYG